MALYAQHGHAKSDKLVTALDAGDLDGIIFGARNEKPANLQSCVEAYRDQFNTGLLLDPQFHVCTLNPPNDRFLPEYPWYAAGRTAADFVGLRRLQQYVQQVIDFQQTLPLSRLIAPTVLFDSFDDRWSQVALNLADTALDYCAGLQNAPPLLLSFAFSEQALASRTDLDSFLDQVTSWDAHGVYLLVGREENAYWQRFDEQRLSQLLYAVYVLSTLNGLEVVNGYSDFYGIALRAAGAQVIGSGWSQGLRQFNRRNFIRRPPGGQPPRLRYSSAPLLNSIFLGELEQIFDVGALDVALSGVPLDEVITSARSPEASDWNARTSELHHWQTLKSLDNALTGDPAADLTAWTQRIQNATALYRRLSSAGVLFERTTGADHLADWRAAVASFRSSVNV